MTPEPVTVLEATGVAKRYGTHTALAGLHLSVRAGEVHGLLGPNGAGKTTFLRVVLGLIRPDAGSVRALGVAVSPGGGLPDGVSGFVEAPAFYPYLSGRRNLELLALLDRGVAAGRVGALLDRVGLGGQEDQPVRGYSAGMRQRLGLAAALLRAPRLLLLDEPTSSLDPAGAHAFRAEVRRAADEGAAVVLSSHDMSEVEDLCSTLTVVQHGRAVFSGTTAELRGLAPAAVHHLRTSDDDAARALAATSPGVALEERASEEGLEVSAAEGALDAYVIALGKAGIAVRGLERRTASLESLFLRITGAEPGAPS